MVKAKYLLIGSVEPYSGKTGTILGLAPLLQDRGLALAYGKPIGTRLGDAATEDWESDVAFIRQKLNLSDARSPVLSLDTTTIEKRIRGTDTTDYQRILRQTFEGINGDLVLLEGAGTLWEGSLFNLSARQIAEVLDASILLVARYHSPLVVESLTKAAQELGDRLVGVAIGDIPPDQLEDTHSLLQPYLEQQGIPVLGLLPSSSVLRSVSVRELVRQLQAKVLCRPDRLDLMVESLTIGAMNVNSALEYFRQGFNKAVVTGGDRTDLQLAALETSTSCLILTGHMAPQPLIISRAEDLEVPILSVNLDTLAAVEIVDRAFGSVRIQEPIKVECIQKLMAEHFDIERLLH